MKKFLFSVIFCIVFLGCSQPTSSGNESSSVPTTDTPTQSTDSTTGLPVVEELRNQIAMVIEVKSDLGTYKLDYNSAISPKAKLTLKHESLGIVSEMYIDEKDFDLGGAGYMVTAIDGLSLADSVLYFSGITPSIETAFNQFRFIITPWETDEKVAFVSSLFDLECFDDTDESEIWFSTKFLEYDLSVEGSDTTFFKTDIHKLGFSNKYEKDGYRYTTYKFARVKGENPDYVGTLESAEISIAVPLKRLLKLD